MGRDLDIGIPDEMTLEDIHAKLVEVKAGVDSAMESIDESIEELRKIKVGTGLTTGVDLDEERV